MAHKAPGKSHRKGITLLELARRFPTEEAAVKWFESVVWPTERGCGHCGSTRTVESIHVKMPYWCSDCRSYFSVRTGTLMERSKVPIQKWVYAIYLDVTSLKGVAAMKLHRDIGVSYKTAWFLLHRIREAFTATGPIIMDGPVEVDETYIGGLEKNKHAKDKLNAGWGPVGKTAVVGAKDRETGKVAAIRINLRIALVRCDDETIPVGTVEESAPRVKWDDTPSGIAGRADVHELRATPLVLSHRVQIEIKPAALSLIQEHRLGPCQQRRAFVNLIEGVWADHNGVPPRCIDNRLRKREQRLARAVDRQDVTGRIEMRQAVPSPEPGRQHLAKLVESSRTRIHRQALEVIDQRLANDTWRRVLRFADRQLNRGRRRRRNADEKCAEPVKRVRFQARERRIQRSCTSTWSPAAT